MLTVRAGFILLYMPYTVENFLMVEKQAMWKVKRIDRLAERKKVVHLDMRFFITPWG